MKRNGKLATRLAGFLVRHPWISLFAVVLIAAALVPGLQFLKFNDDYRVYFSPENEDLVAWDNLLDTYSRSDSLIIIVEAKDGKKIFSPKIMPSVVELTDELWRVPYVTRVDSISNFQHIYSEADEIIVRDLVPADKATDSEFLAKREAIAHHEPQLKDRVFAKDGTATAIFLQMMIPKEQNAIANAADNINELRREFMEKHPDVNLRLGGLVALNAAFDHYARSDMATIFPIMLVIIIVISMVLFRSPLATVSLLLTMILSVIATMGAAGYMHIELSPHSSIAPQIMLTVAIATGIHMLASFLRHLRHHENKGEALIATMEHNLLPISLTSLTTCIGFYSMLLSDIPPLQHLGMMCGTGMILAFGATVVFLPSLLMLLPFRIVHFSKDPGMERHWTDWLANFVLGHRGKIIVVALIALVPLSYGIANLEVNDHPIHLFSKKTEFRKDADFIDEHLAGTTNIQFSLNAGEAGGINDPEFMRKVERFKEYLLADPLVQHVSVLPDTMKRINYSMHSDDDNYYRLPDDRDTIAQYLLFYEMNLPFGLELNNEINVDKSAIRMIAIIKSSGSKKIVEFLDRTHGWLDKEIPEFQARGVSVLVMFSYMAKRLAGNMFFTAFVATTAIAFVLILALRSLRLGLLSLIPNLLPILIVFGLWSLVGNTLDFAASLIFSMTLGVVVDDTVHFLSRYLQAEREQGMSPADAVRTAIRGVGPAMVYSTVVLVLGFIIFITSNFHTNVTLGILTALTFVVALVLDLILLPVLLSYLKPERKVSQAAVSPTGTI